MAHARVQAFHTSVSDTCHVALRANGYCPRVVRIGVAREIKTDEYRVALTPAGALELVQRGHDVLVETRAGDGSAFADDGLRARRRADRLRRRGLGRTPSCC